MAIMALDKAGRKYLKEIGLEPAANRAILVEYAPSDDLNFMDKVANFFSTECYILQMCRDELVLIPIEQTVTGFAIFCSSKEEVALRLPYSDIRSVEMTKKGINHVLSIVTDSETICLLSPNQVVSAFMGGLGCWHIRNMEDTLQALKNLPVSVG